MNRKVMRKSTLISSIAMLLVAVLALSGVTFAWFSSNPSASTGKVTMNSSAVSGIYIQETATDVVVAPTVWKTELKWDYELDLKPVTCAFKENDTTFWKTTTTLGDGTWDGVTGIVEATDTDGTKEGDYFAKKIWIRADVPAGVKKDLVVTVNFGGDTPQNYQRFAIVNLTDGMEGHAVFSRGTESRTYGAFIDDKGTEYSVTTVTADTAMGNVLVTEYEGGTVLELLVFNYFEGQDKDCKNENSSANVTVNLTFELKDTGKATVIPGFEPVKEPEGE